MTDAGKITAIIDGDISALTSALNRAESQATAAISGIEGDFKSKMGSGIGAGISDSMSGMAASMGPIGGALSAVGPAGIAAGAAIAGVGMALSSSVNVAAQFQQTMSGVAAVAGASAPELEAMSAAAREAGASSVFSASQAAEAMGFLASSGMSVTDTIATLEPTLMMAAAGGLELASAGDLMAGSLAQFGLSAGSATSVADTLAAGAAASNASIAQLGQGLQNVGPMAANVGMSLQETTAALGVFANSNIKGAEAGTALKSMLASLLEPSKGAAAALSEMGLSADDVNPSLHSYDEIMSKMKDSHMSAQQAVAIFGKEMASNAMVAVNGADGYDKLLEKVKETGKASEMAKTQTANYAGALSEFSGAVEEAQIAVGTLLLPTLTDLTKIMTGLINGTTETGGFISDFATGISDSLSTAFSGGSLADVDSAFLSALGVSVGETVTESTEEGMVEGTDAAQDDIQGSVEEAVGEGAKDAFENVSPELANIMKGFGVGDAAALAIMNAQTRRVQDDRNSAGVTSTTLENGLRVDLKYQTDDGMTRATLLVNGQEVAGPVYGWGIEKTLPELFRQAGQEYNQGNVLDLTGKLGDSAIWAASQTTDIVLDSFLDVTSSTKGEIKAAGEEIAEAFAAGMTPDKAQVEAAISSLQHLQLYDPEEAKAQGSQNAIAYLTAIKEAIESYDEAKAKYLVEPDNERARADLERARANLQAQLDANPLKATVTTTWGQFDTKSFAELIMDPEAVKNAALDINKFFDGTIVPGIRGGMENARSAFEQGQITQGMVYDNLIKPLEQYADYLPGWLEEMNSMFKSGQIGIDDYIWLLDQMTGKASAALDKTSEKLKSQSVGWDALKDTIGECSDCAISDFAQWQESQDGLFQDSYIGQGGQQYLDWKTEQINAIAETQAAMRAVGGTVLGQDYTQSPLLSVGVDADTTLAESKLEGLKSTITGSQPIMKVDLDTTIADTKFMNLFQTIQNARPVMNVDINPLIDLGGIIGMIESALRSAGL